MNSKLQYVAVALFVVCPSWLAAENDATSLFKSKCAMCHAEDGSGNSPSGKALKARDLRSQETQSNSDAEISDVITKGQNKMPAFGQKLKPDQIQKLVAYVRKLAKK